MHTSVGIITTHRVHNCGSFLQAYALQTAIKQWGYRIKFIDYVPYRRGSSINRFDAPVLLSHILHYLIRDILHRRWALVIDDIKLLRWNWMLRTKLYLTRKTFTSIDSLSVFCPKCDIYVVGSDQVWNERFMHNDSAYMLSFAPEGSRKFSYASSVANVQWSNDFKDLIRKHLTSFDKISCREKVNAHTLSLLINKEVSAVLDPVMLLSADDWLRLLNIKTSNYEGGYILFFTYNYMQDIHQLSLSVLDEAIRDNPGKAVWSYKAIHGRNIRIVEMDTPATFVNTIKNAHLVISDSFHAIAFSLLFNVPVMRVDTNGKSDVRIEDLCQRVATFDGSLYRLDSKKMKEELAYSRHFLHEALTINR